MKSARIRFDLPNDAARGFPPVPAEIKVVDSPGNIQWRPGATLGSPSMESLKEMSAPSLSAAELSGDPNGSTPGFQPYVPDKATIPELTFPAVTLGALLGIVFGASSLYLFLKVGMTVSASIPIAVLSTTIFRALSKAFGTRRATILENNIVQTAGSAGESIAFGVGATMPALMILGYDMEWSRVMLVSVLGGLLGILMMIPLRRAFIVKQHGTLIYPEGTACAKILEAGEQGGSSARMVFSGFGLAFAFKFLMDALKLWNNSPSKLIEGVKGYKNAVIGGDADPTLLGVGYIIGTRTACVMVAGGILSALVLTPAISFFGQGLKEAIPPGTIPIDQMGPSDVFKSYVRYIGAGAVATAGIISLIRALPLIVSSVVGGVRDLGSRGEGGEGTSRTQRDLPIVVVALGCLALVAAIASSHLIPTNLAGRIAGACMILVFGFLFVTVSSRLTGEIGSSSNPISGMTIATLLMTCLIFVILGWVGPEYRVTALSIAAIVCIASSNGGTTSQDLKTGYLIGATPRSQQLSIVVGAATSAVVIGGTLLWLNSVCSIETRKAEYLPKVPALESELTGQKETRGGEEYRVARVAVPRDGVLPGRYLVDGSLKFAALDDPGIGGRVNVRDDGTKVEKFNPPQPALFAVIIDGIMTQKLPWALVLLGAGIAIVMYLAGVSALAFAVGVYLPLSTTVPIFIGGMIRALVERRHQMTPEESDSSPAVLMASGLIAGGSLAGIMLATLEVPIGFVETAKKALDMTKTVGPVWEKLPVGWQDIIPAVVAFGLVCLVLLAVGLGGGRPEERKLAVDIPEERPDM